MLANFNLTLIIRKAEMQARNCDLSYWRTADTLEICNETIISDCKITDYIFKVDKPLKYEDAPSVYLVFRKYDVCRYIQASILSTARLDAIIAYSIDALRDQFEESRPGNPSQSSISAGKDFVFFSCLASADKQNCIQRDGHKTARHNQSIRKTYASGKSAVEFLLR